MKVGDLIYDSHFEEHGLVVEICKSDEWCIIFYEDGQTVDGIRVTEETIKVINESR